jgi:hypothetical protein
MTAGWLGAKKPKNRREPDLAVVLLGVLVLGALVLLILYAWRSIATRIKFQYERRPRRGIAADQPEEPLPPFSLL